MSDVIAAAVEALNTKLGENRLDGSAKFIIGDKGSVVIDGAGVRASDEDTDVSLTADTEIFQDILAGDLDPTAAFMAGSLSVDGDMQMAMQLAGLLS